MENQHLTSENIRFFLSYLLKQEKSQNTIEKYMRDIQKFKEYIGEESITKESVVHYKKSLLTQKYAVSSINSMLSSLNSLFTFLGWREYKTSYIQVQRQLFRAEEKELTRIEYQRLIHTAERQGNTRLSLLLQTICSTGIRVSEICYITVEAVAKGKATVLLKRKNRTILILKKLQKKLLRYAAEQNIQAGPIFITRNNMPLNRTQIWREMKKLCTAAHVCPQKVFPHNLRHLFARAFYMLEKDIAKLADLLGHSSIETTRIYIMTTGEQHRKQMERMHLIL